MNARVKRKDIHTATSIIMEAQLSFLFSTFITSRLVIRDERFPLRANNAHLRIQ
jgi:hypothetical protein